MRLEPWGSGSACSPELTAFLEWLEKGASPSFPDPKEWGWSER